MELDELKVAWQAQARAVDTLRAVNVQLLRMLEADRAQSALRRWGRLPTYELVAGIVAQLWLVRFLSQHLGAPAMLVSGAVLSVAAFLAVLVAARQLVMLAEVDYAAPVAELQERLERLQALRVRSTRWTLLLAPLLWTPLVLVAAQAFLGLDLLQRARPWVLANLLSGLACIPLGLWGIRWAAARWGQSRFWTQLRDDVGGRTLARALRSLDELAAFRREA
ncbi:MAG: hypothetical protein ACXWK8_09510 [Myxococcaceae bacterium]